MHVNSMFIFSDIYHKKHEAPFAETSKINMFITVPRQSYDTDAVCLSLILSVITHELTVGKGKG